MGWIETYSMDCMAPSFLALRHYTCPATLVTSTNFLQFTTHLQV